jgi:glutamine synthetase
LIHEIGAGQMEVNFLHGDPLDLADRVFYFKRTLREAALRHKMYATFMAKPMANEPGSAMHIHQSVVERKTGRNIFSNIDGSPSDAFRHYIAGLQKYLPAAMAFLAPYVNSYRRLGRHAASPINIRWGRDNRTVGIRVPRSSPEARRVENRVIGADANPYVATAVTLACGYLGMKERLEPSEESSGHAHKVVYELPRTMSEALNLLSNTPELARVVGERFATIYRLVKELEYDEFMKVISSWEREHLLLHV